MIWNSGKEKPKRKPKEWAYIDEDDTLIFQPGVKVKSILPDRERGTVHCKGKPKPTDTSDRVGGGMVRKK